MQETWDRSWNREDLLEEGMTAHFSILSWRNPMDKGAWWATVHGVTKSRAWLKWLSTAHTKVKRQEKMDGQGQGRKREFALSPHFCSSLALKRLVGVCLHQWGLSSFLDWLGYMLIFSGKTLTNTPRNNVLPAIWHPLAQTSWHRKLAITTHKVPLQSLFNSDKVSSICSSLSSCH